MHVVFAHGVVGRSRLPVSLWVIAYLVGMAVVLLSFASDVRLKVPWWRFPTEGRAALRLLGVGTFAAVVVSAWFGDRGRTSTPALVVYIVLWVGLPLVALVLGDLWRFISPWDLSIDDAPPPLLAPTHWPAAAGALGFVWLELCYHDPSARRSIGIAALTYAAVMVTMAWRRGRAWLRTGDVFAVWSTLVAGVRDLRTVETRPGTRALLVVIVGSVTFDVVTRTARFNTFMGDRTGWAKTPILTAGLVVCIALVAVASLAVRDTRALVPVALAWLLALYLSLLLVEGQALIAAASDPLGRGWNLFGTAQHDVDFRLVPDALITWAQLGLLAGGHALGLSAARDRRTVAGLAAFAVIATLLLLGR